MFVKALKAAKKHEVMMKAFEKVFKRKEKDYVNINLHRTDFILLQILHKYDITEKKLLKLINNWMNNVCN